MEDYFSEEINRIYKNEIDAYRDWENSYGPMTKFGNYEPIIDEIDPKLVWTEFDGGEYQFATNKIFNSADNNELITGYYLAKKPHDSPTGEIYVATVIWIECENCKDAEEDMDCDLCDGLGDYHIDLKEWI